MIDIKLTDKYRLRNDENCFMLCKHSPEKDKPDYYKPFAYYSDLSSLLDVLPVKMVMLGETVDGDDIRTISDLAKQIHRWIDLVGAGLERTTTKPQTHAPDES